MSVRDVRSIRRVDACSELPGRVFLLLPLEGRLDLDLEVNCWEGSSVKREDDLVDSVRLFACSIKWGTHALFDIAVSVVEALLLLDRDGGKGWL